MTIWWFYLAWLTIHGNECLEDICGICLKKPLHFAVPVHRSWTYCLQPAAYARHQPRFQLAISQDKETLELIYHRIFHWFTWWLVCWLFCLYMSIATFCLCNMVIWKYGLHKFFQLGIIFHLMPTHFTLSFLANHIFVVHSMIGYWQNPVILLSVRPSICP